MCSSMNFYLTSYFWDPLFSFVGRSPGSSISSAAPPSFSIVVPWSPERISTSGEDVDKAILAGGGGSSGDSDGEVSFGIVL